jgi:UPF0716 protein FxsA
MGCLYIILLILWPVAELHVLYRASESFGFLPVFLALVVSAIAGSALMSRPKRGAFGRARDIWTFGVQPGKQLLATTAIWMAGLLLLIPGFLSDIVALLLLIPWTRDLLYYWFIGRKIQKIQHHERPAPEDVVIDVEWEEVD